MDKCREEFEVFLLSSGYSEDALHKSQHCDYYSRSFTRESWKAWQKAWQASRESMKAIKLPKKQKKLRETAIGDLITDSCNLVLKSCKDAITSAGYKVE